ncbi:hypothetical protein MNBD_IGNAVI01-316 [hydrothermal vent metagenome]|uniref:DUF4861 domain-containing protein n=1 Tax=hydrothermal vent metagenome TaxID=652676 RepID=A0A3B1CKA0_9ZZZZ
MLSYKILKREMKNIQKLQASSIFILITCVGLFAQENQTTFTVANEQNISRIHETVSIDLSKTNFTSNVGVTDDKNNSIVSQLIDNDGDDKFDELIFQDDFKGNETKTYHLKKSDKKEQTESKVYATVVEGREDIAWESDKIAFRMYGPPLAKEVDNGIDVWVKSVDYLIVDKWYREEEEGIKSYHVDGGEGADFFSVGRSLGAGGSAITLNDSLFQSGVYKSYKILANGPIRTMFKLNYEFDVNGKKITEEKTIQLDAGSYINKIMTRYSTVPDDAKFVAGLVKRGNTSVSTDFDNSIISLWGDISNKKSDGELGTAVILPYGNNLEIIEDSTHILLLSSLNDKPMIYYAGADWTKREDFASEKDWLNYVKDTSLKIRNPLNVKIVK